MVREKIQQVLLNSVLCFLVEMLMFCYFLRAVNLLDLYAFVIGSYVICTAVAGARYTNEYVKTRTTAQFLKHIWKWSGIVLKSSALLSIWVKLIS